MPAHVIVGLGELLWDCLPEGKKLGGAPANFAYHATILGNTGIVATRVGTDDMGDEAVGLLNDAGLDTSHVQRDPDHATGTVDVTVDAKGHATYTFASDVAWDHMELTGQWLELAKRTDAVCFGSLAQRCPQSKETVRAFLRALPPRTLRIFDVNMRQHFYDAETIDASLKLCDVLKLNEEELPIMTKLLGIEWTDEKQALEHIRNTYDLKLVCHTRSDRGYYFLSQTECCDHPGYRVNVADTIGAGDAFTATVAHHWLAGAPLNDIAQAAGKRGAWVATQVGAMPPAAAYDESLFLASAHV